MSADKLVDSTQLDSDLTSVANAIRAKSGGSSQLAFPSGFVSEIGNISGGYSVSAVFNQGENLVFTTDDLDDLKQYLVVTVTYADSSTETLADGAYTLSGTLTAGTSTITVTAMKKTATFTVAVTAATDVTPSFSRWAAGASSTATKNMTDGAILAESDVDGTYRNANAGITLESGFRYRFSAHVDFFAGYAKLVFSNSSWNWITGCYSSTLYESGDIVLDCKPSDASNFTASAHLMLYCTTTVSAAGKAVFKKIKVIKYAA